MKKWYEYGGGAPVFNEVFSTLQESVLKLACSGGLMSLRLSQGSTCLRRARTVAASRDLQPP